MTIGTSLLAVAALAAAIVLGPMTGHASRQASRGKCLGRPATITGTSKGEVLRGTRGRDVIDARGGDDTIRAGGGADLLCGGAGSDLLEGESGKDRLTGGRGLDECYLGAGGGKASACELPLRRAPLFGAVTPEVTRDYAGGLAASAFGLRGAVAEDGHVVTVTDGTRSLTVYKASGALHYEDNAKLWRPSYAGPTRSKSAAISFAREFVRRAGLLPPATAVAAAELVPAEGEPKRNHWRVAFAVRVRVSSKPPVFAPLVGATLDVRVGNREVIGLYRHWRALKPARMLRLLSRESRALSSEFGRAQIDAPALHYRLEPEHVRQRFVAPYYALRSRQPSVPAVVPAASFGPTVRIVSPAGDDVPAGEPVTLQAEVSNGTPPYEYYWFSQSSPGETLAESNRATVTLPGGTHAVHVIVTDRNGMVAQALRTVRVAAGPEPMLRVSSAKPSPADPWRVQQDRRGGADHLGWSMRWFVSPDDGLGLLDVKYKGNVLAWTMNLPFYQLETELMPLQACELEEDAAAGSKNCWSKLVDVAVEKARQALKIEATYQVHGLPLGPDSGGMRVKQRYVFLPERTGCAQLDIMPCADFKPYVEYQYAPPPAPPSPSNKLRQFLAYQRFNWDVPQQDIAGVFRAHDGGRAFLGARIPSLGRETGTIVADWKVDPANGSGLFDDYHQRRAASLGATDPRVIVKPGCTGTIKKAGPAFVPAPVGGSWTCLHVHWRWPRLPELVDALKQTNRAFGSGRSLVPKPQRVWIYVVRPRPQEADPPNFDVPALVTARPSTRRRAQTSSCGT